MCKFCEKFDFDSAGIDMTSWSTPSIYLCGGLGKTPIEQKFKFCPMCGKPIIYTEEKENETLA